jgi:Mrp family chromosome partitioning ATPase
MSHENPSFPNNFLVDAARRATQSNEFTTASPRVVNSNSANPNSATSTRQVKIQPTPKAPSAAELSNAKANAEPQTRSPIQASRSPAEFPTTPARPISLNSLNRLRVDASLPPPPVADTITRFDPVIATASPSSFEVTTKPWTIVAADFASPDHPSLQPYAFAASPGSNSNDILCGSIDELEALTEDYDDERPAVPFPTANEFAPAWEVDQFCWPEIVLQLEQTNTSVFHQVGQHLAQSNRSGLRVLAVTSGERGVGRSTVAMHMARAASTAGLRVALVDADALHPSLVDQLRLDIDTGWQHCLFDGFPLEEAAVHSIADGITFFPITKSLSTEELSASLVRASKLIERIASHFDLIILDSCRISPEQPDLVGVTDDVSLDAAVVVVDSELSVPDKIDAAISLLQDAGLTSIGIVENFRSGSSQPK